MEQLVELTKALHTSMQLKQHQLLQEEKLEIPTEDFSRWTVTITKSTSVKRQIVLRNY